MTPSARRFAAVFAACLLTACQTVPSSLQAARETDVPPGVTPFEKTLAQQYYIYAEELRTEGDRHGSEVMAERALKTLRGHPPRAAVPGPEADLDLRQAYGYAAAALSAPELTRARQEDSAQLRFLYDCWAWETQYRPEGPRAGGCRESFFTALEHLHTAEVAAPSRQASRSPAAAPQASHPKEIPGERFRLGTSRSGAPRLSAGIRAALKKAAAAFRAHGAGRVIVEGYSYGSKNEHANLSNSLKYARGASDLLHALGAPRDKIDVHAMGSLPDEKGKREGGTVIRFPLRGAR